MDIIITNSSEKPIYEQISMQIKKMIMDGILNSGDNIPPIRKLAKDLHVSVITVQRAYDNLSRDGFVETVAGKGCFVSAQNKDFIKEEKLRIAEDYLNKAATIGKINGITLEYMINSLRIFYEND